MQAVVDAVCFSAGSSVRREADAVDLVKRGPEQVGDPREPLDRVIFHVNETMSAPVALVGEQRRRRLGVPRREGLLEAWATHGRGRGRARLSSGRPGSAAGLLSIRHLPWQAAVWRGPTSHSHGHLPPMSTLDPSSGRSRGCRRRLLMLQPTEDVVR